MTTAIDIDVLLRAILIDPADDLARLAYADALEEEGEAELATLIRLSLAAVDNAAMSAFQKLDLFDRMRCGLPPGWRCGPPFVGPIQTVVQRGFVELVSCKTDDFLAHAKELFTRHPITEVRLMGVSSKRLNVPQVANGSPVWYAKDDRIEAQPLLEFTAIERFGWLPNDPQVGFLRGYLPQGPDRRPGVYATDEDAYAALGVACVAYGRTLAGLPPLPGELDSVP